MSTDLKIRDIVKFVLKHRRGTRAFQWYTIPQLVEMFRTRLPVGTAGVVVEGNKITGVALGAFRKDNTLHAEHVLCSTRLAFSTFRHHVRTTFPGVSVSANHRSKPRTYRKL